MILIPGRTTIDYDENKNQKNIKKHGYSLEEAKHVLEEIMLLQPKYIVSEDYEKNYETRFNILGTYKGDVVTLACTLRDEGEVVRVINMHRVDRGQKILDENPPSFDVSELLGE